MPRPEQAPHTLTQAEKDILRSYEDAKRAETLDKDPELPGAESENLTVVETPVPTPAYSHPKMRLTDVHLDRMSLPEIRAVAHDRGYFNRTEHRGIQNQGRHALKAAFLEAQAKDTALHDAPGAAEASA